MSIFARRRLQHMLDEIGHRLRDAQINDLLTRLEHRDVGPALAAEFELGLLWAISSVTETDLHPKLVGSPRRPEAFCPRLFPSGPAFVEITAVSDDSFSDRDKMERAANIISQFTESIRKGSSKHLYFQFTEKSSYENGRYQRFRRIKKTFELTPPLRETLRIWISNADWPNPKHIRLTDETIDVVIQWQNQVHPSLRTFSTMPAIAYDLEDNPVFRRLKVKKSQLSKAPSGSLKCIFLGDAGCDTLRDLTRFDPTNRAVNGEQIIWHFLDNSSVDLVAVFSPQSKNIYNPIRSPRIWRVTYFDKRNSVRADEYAGLQSLAKALPPPNYEGYQARSLYRQGSFNPQARGHYLGTIMYVEDMKKMKTEIKFPARLFQELIAGRVSLEQFRHFSSAFELFESELKSGRTLCNARLEATGLDEDDDYLVFEFAPDAAALPLKRPKHAQN